MILLLDVGHSACKYLIAGAATIDYFLKQSSNLHPVDMLPHLQSLGDALIGAVPHPDIKLHPLLEPSSARQPELEHTQALEIFQAQLQAKCYSQKDALNYIYIASSGGAALVDKYDYLKNIIKNIVAINPSVDIKYIDLNDFSDFQINYSPTLGIDRLLFANAARSTSHLHNPIQKNNISAHQASMLISCGSAITFDLFVQKLASCPQAPSKTARACFYGGVILPNLLHGYDYLIKHSQLPIKQSLSQLNELFTAPTQAANDFFSKAANSTQMALQQGFILQCLAQIKIFETHYLNILAAENISHDHFNIYITGGAAGFFHQLLALSTHSINSIASTNSAGTSFALHTPMQNIYLLKDAVLLGLLIYFFNKIK